MSTEQLPRMKKALELTKVSIWKYETDEFDGVCEIAHDKMTVRCVFEAFCRSFYDVLGIDGVIRYRLLSPVSVERLAEQLSDDFPDLRVTVFGRAATHGWISSTVGRAS